MDNIIYIASLITAITAIITTIYKFIKFCNEVLDKFEEYDKAIKDNTLQILKITLLNASLPIEERIHAGDEYIARGGNGLGKKVYNELLKEVHVYDTIN